MKEKAPQDAQNINEPIENTAKDSQIEMIFTVDSPYAPQIPQQTWYQQNQDVFFPLFVIAIGLFQYVLRKWILPVDKDLIFDLEDQSPGYGIALHPGFGAFIMIVGVIMLVLFNLDYVF